MVTAITSLSIPSIRNTRSIPKYRPVRRNTVRMNRPFPLSIVLSLNSAAVV